jgi:phosphatidate cytidylyltransferase
MSASGPAGGKWGDLSARIGSAAAMAVIGIAAIWAGGIWFALLCTLGGTLMVWELAAMLDPGKHGAAIRIGAIAALGLLTAFALATPFALIPLLLPAAVAGAVQRREALIFSVYGTTIMLVCYGLVALREDHGAVWLGWLVAVVVATDVAGYFAGRILGGPKFWPRVSPKKTWSGTVAGWIAAGIVGFLFHVWAGPSLLLVPVSVGVALASQMGDIAESAIKRRAGPHRILIFQQEWQSPPPNSP